MFKPMCRRAGPSSQSCAPTRLPEYAQAWFLPFLYLLLGAIVCDQAPLSGPLQDTI